MGLAVGLGKLLVALVCLAGAGLVRSPGYAELRPWLLVLLLAGSALTALASLGWRRNRLELVPFAISIAALLFTASIETRFQLTKRAVLRAEPATLQKLSRHIIVGFGQWDAVRALVTRGLIGGVFVTRRNVVGLDAAAIAGEIAALQAIRRAQALPPLWIATDQEGGGVARMTPPLPRQPTLATATRNLPGTDRQSAVAAIVAAYALEQGRGLAGLGFNLNFAPVVDLDHGVNNPADAYSRISSRAISADPAVVADVAGIYCDGLAAVQVLCTLKHFPGLGRVFEDTHVNEGALRQSVAELEATDWVPFRRLLGDASGQPARPAVMVGHVRLPALDPAQPVSTSAVAINGLLRTAWGFDGLVITDDLCMGAIYNSREGIGRASVGALNAGVDLLLISWDGDQLYPVLAALLAANTAGGPDGLADGTLARSARRLQTASRISAGR
jgi:beta-N-acetylhexosaminidase